MRSGSEVRSRRQVNIHPTAIVHPDAEIAEGVEIGPYTVIEGPVKIGPGTIVGPRVTIEGYTTIGAENEIFTGAVIGSRTQDKKFDGGISYLKIGDRNKIREYVTINPGTKATTETVIGDDNLLMAYAHVAHDCVVKNRTILANVATLAGHVTVEDGAIIGGISAVHQFVKIGKLALIGGCSKVVQDVPPFVIADGHPARAHGLNMVGLERAGFSPEDRLILKKVYRIIFKSAMTLKKAVATITEEFPPSNPHIQHLIQFLIHAERGICR
ncbi:MAG: acyl-ACP--UDP-N-acetylglucosamine O-acyltransferase [Candidatus Omnitrophica bacterium]|nr:acyl-ACP--UDP-N-acetylglucosamine O-acyltransferase [Candidatus Omnitrophota bacterium]